MSLSSESPSNLSDSSFASSFLDNGDDVGYNEPLPFEDWPSPEKLLLHGNLDIWIDKARNLPHSRHLHRKLIDKVHKEVSHKLRKHLHIHDSSESLGKKLRSKMASEFHKHMPHLSEHFVSIWLSKVDAKAKKKSKAAIGRSRVIRDDWDPLWNQYFSVPVAHYAGEVGFVVENNDLISAQRVGAVTIPAAQIVSGVKIEGSFPLYNSEREPTGAVLSISIQYTSIERLGIYSRGVRSSPESDGSGSGVQGAYFPLRKGGIVKLYQDAHVPDGHLPEVKLDHGLHYEHGKCWEDIFEAICGARRLVYIAGWAVNHKIRLVRENGFTSGCRLTLGELLKTKSEEGTRVLLLVWDDPTSRHFAGFKLVCQKFSMMQSIFFST
uniref:C2 domain-containing protein n=1 Tax=Nelumbo nucifera TaxID=4432 RepID=A0A822YCR7_NELNU|nr:TPA_asm: hypothetical protein HUJ06_010775 [Nelumbo nucifera]